jgi:hypothetical protein
MIKSSLKEVRKLPQTNETWHCGFREMPAWVVEDDGPIRPFIGLVADQERQLVLGQEMRSEMASADQALTFLLNTMAAPLPPEIAPSRPGRIHLNNDILAEQLRDRLLSLNIQVRSFPTLPVIDFLMEEIGAYLEDEGMGGGFPSLVKIPGVEEKWLREYFSAAAEYAQAEPWQWIDDSKPVAVRFPAGGPERYLVIMGHGKETYGLATYESMESLALTYDGAPPQIAVQYGALMSVILDNQEIMAFADLDAINYHQWPVAGPEAYPAVMKLQEAEDDIEPPTPEDLIFLSAALRMLPVFVQRHLVTPKGLRATAQQTFTLPAIYAQQEIEFCYPVDLDEMENIAIQDAAINFMDELTFALESGQISPEDIDLNSEELHRLRLLNFIQEWAFQQDQLPLVLSMGSFMLAFGDHMFFQELLTESTVDSHMDNAFYIGDFILEDEKLVEFSPREIFRQPPQYVAAFRAQVSNAKTRVASYERTWRKLRRFAEIMEIYG